MNFSSGLFVYDIIKYRCDRYIKELLGGIRTVCWCTEVVYLQIFNSFMDDLSDTAFYDFIEGSGSWSTLVATRVLSMEFQLDVPIISVDPKCALLQQLYF